MQRQTSWGDAAFLLDALRGLGLAVAMLKNLIICWALSAWAMAGVHELYVGTRTDRESKGLYRMRFDDQTGELKAEGLVATYANPGFLCQHPSKPLIYTVGNRADGTGTVAVFSVVKNKPLNFLADVAVGGQGPCHLAIDATAAVLAVANYGDGSTSSFLLDGKGMPSEPVSVIKHTGKSVHPQRQTAPHAHGVYFSGSQLLVPDLGTDQVLVYEVDAKTAALTAATPPHAALAPGDGPRHLVLHPQNPWVYVVNELSNTITHFTREEQGLKAQKIIATLPKDFSGVNTTAEIEIHPNGRFLYASNRGHDSIAAYRIEAKSGALELLGIFPLSVKTPRHFAIAPGGAFLIAAGQDSDGLQTFAIDPQTGKLSAVGKIIEVPSPTCLLFARP
jgi:6-phosphogluconolactonase